MDKTVHILVGLPGSGKSTLRRTIVDNLQGQEQVFISSSDDIIDFMAAKAGKKHDDIYCDVVKFAGKASKQLLEASMRAGVPTVIVDKTNLSRGARQYPIDLAKHHEYRVFAHVLLAPAPEEHRRRLDSRDRFISEKRIEEMKQTYEEPKLEEGFDSIIYH